MLTSAATVANNRATVGPNQTWLAAIVDRLQDLITRPANWDSHGGYPLSPKVLSPLFTFLIRYGNSVQSAPSLSLTPVGGLFVLWRSPESELSLEFDPEQEQPEVEFERSIDGFEEYGSLLTFSDRINKMIWQSSSALA